MKADFIYRHIQHETGLPEVLLCLLHKPCFPTMHCDSPQQTRLLNFDNVKEIWNSLHPEVATPASVDALTCKNERLCMVELKGGVKFLQNEPLAQKEKLTEKQIEIFQDKIVRKVGRFDFRKKLSDSIRICEDFTKVENLHELFQIEYLVVTDLQRNENPLLNLMENLNFLGNNSSDWATYYINTLETRVGSVNVKGIIPKLVCCKEFDAFLEKL